VRIKHLQLVTQKHSVTVTKTLTAYSPFGPVRAGLTTLQTTNEARLTELLSSLESVVASLVSKSSTVLDTLTTATKEMLAEPLPSTIDEGGIDE
jgi:hypothetical protein